MDFKEYINERFVNAFVDDVELKNKYKKQVWDILQTSYKDIGGIKGNGFNSPDDMVAKIPFWKMFVQNGVVHGVVMYKDKNGRKSVAAGTDGSPYGKKHMGDTMKNDIMLKRSFGEKSKASLGMTMKLIPWDVLEPFVKTPEEVRKLSKGDEIVAFTEYKGEVDANTKITLEKYPQLKPYGYYRELAGKMEFKVMLGTSGNKIK